MIRLSESEKASLNKVEDSKGLDLASWSRAELLKTIQEKPLESSHTIIAASEELPLLSLFCGPGGLDEGFRQAGFHTVLASDVDADCVNTFAANHKHSIVFQKDINELTVDEILERAGDNFAPVGVIGGPPCQSFSVSNVHQKGDDPRHKLPEAYANLLAKLNARNPISFFVFENVPGLLRKKHNHRYIEFKKLLQNAGFEIAEHLLNAKYFGVPQDRSRIIIVGINHDLHPGKIWSAPVSENSDDNIKTVRETIFGLPEPVYNARGLNPELFEVHPNHWCLVPRSSKFKEAKLEQGQMWGRSFRTLSWNEPSWTVAYGHREVHVHPKGHRRLSIYEALLLQSFPKKYRLKGNLTAQIRLVSEAVPPRMAWHIANSIRSCLRT